MIIRLCEYNWTNEDESGMDKPHIIKAYTENDIDKVIIFVKEMLHRGVRVGDDWYTIEDYIWNFPESQENVPSLDIYVTDTYESF